MLIKKEPTFLFYQFFLDEHATRVAGGKSRSVISMSIKRLFCLLLKNGKTVSLFLLISLLLTYILSMQPLRKTNPPMVIYATVLKVLVSIDHCVELCHSLLYLDYPGMASTKRFLSTFFFFFLSLSLALLLYLAGSSPSFTNINNINISYL